MRFLITGITGNTGAAAARALLAAGHSVRALVRNPSRAAAWSEQGVELVAGEIGDVDALSSALAGVDGAYLLVPPQWGSPDVFAATGVLIDAMDAALTRQPVPRIVALSSVAVQVPKGQGSGPIATLQPLEAALARRSGTTAIRAAYFHQNLASSLQPVLGAGVLPVFHSPEVRFEMVSTEDIGREVAAQLVIPPGEAAAIVNLTGPEAHTMTEVAQMFSTLLCSTITPVPQPLSVLADALKGMGAGHLGDLYVEMNQGLDHGVLVYEPGAVLTRGTTPLSASLAQLLPPAA